MTKPNSRVKDGKASTVISAGRGTGSPTEGKPGNSTATSAGRGAGSPTEGKPGTSTNPKTFAQVTEVKSKSLTKRSQSLSNTVLNTNTISAPQVSVNEATVLCKICKSDCLASDKAVSCDTCNGWVHMKCSKLSKQEYYFIEKSEGKNSIKWYCQVCVDTQNSEHDLCDIISKQTTQIENLSQQVSVLQKSLAEVLEILKGKKVEEKKVEEVVHTQVTEALDDNKEREEKRSNIILFNVPEAANKDTKAEKEEDMITINNIFQEVHGEEEEFTPLNPNRITRLGGRKDGSTRPRPIRVTLDSTEEKWTIVRRSKNIRKVDAYKDITVQMDKTRKELQADRLIKAKCTEKRKQTGLDYVIFAQEIMLRDDIPAFKRNRQYLRENPHKDIDKEVNNSEQEAPWV